MGRGHAISGGVTGLLAAPYVPFPTLPGASVYASNLVSTVAFAGLVALFALFPDIDHPPATITRMFPPLTWPLCLFFMWLSRRLYQATRTPLDRPGAFRARRKPRRRRAASLHQWFFARSRSCGYHRTLTHTNVFAVTLGVVVFAGLVFTPARPWALDTAVAVTLGCLTHVWFVGDACTLSGVPHPLAPVVVVRGKRWSTVGFPEFMRFRAGGDDRDRVHGEDIATAGLLGLLCVVGVLTVVSAGRPWWSALGVLTA
jgi:hypothetical protein